MKTFIRYLIAGCFLMAIISLMRNNTPYATLWLVLAVFNQITDGRLE